MNSTTLSSEVIGCFHAAESEGLTEALANTTDERLKDLVERRLMHALYAAENETPMRVLGYVRKEMLELCKVANNAAALTVVPNPPKGGRWVAIYVDKDAA